MTGRPLRVGVVGGSIGGLTTALVLRDLGHDVTVHERSPAELEQRGAGIGLLEATARYLVQRTPTAIESISTTTRHIRYLHRDGSVTHDEEHRYLFTSWNTVYRHLLAAWDRSRYLLGDEMTTVDQDDAAATVRFADGRSERYDLVVCADGVGSTARSVLLPEVRPSYPGYVAWRCMVPEHELSASTRAALDDAITYYVFANSHLLVYPIPGADGSPRPGDRLLNVVWYRNYLPGDDVDDLMTDIAGTRRDLSLPPGAVRPEHVAEAKAVAEARLPAPIAEVVTTAEQLFVQAIFDIDVPRMAFGRVCLLGDAAFVARPHAAAGTAKAADDAWALADALAARPDPAGALAAWEPARLALGRALLDRTRRVGERSQVLGTWQPGDPELIFGLAAPGR